LLQIATGFQGANALAAAPQLVSSCTPGVNNCPNTVLTGRKANQIEGGEFERAPTRDAAKLTFAYDAYCDLSLGKSRKLNCALKSAADWIPELRVFAAAILHTAY
jgi:hypothetical protein